MNLTGYFLRPTDRRQELSRKKIAVKNHQLIYLCAFLFGCSGVCFAQTQPAPQDDTQIWPEVQITVPLKKSIDLIASGQLRIGRNVSDFVDERGGMSLAFKINKYLTLTPGYMHIATQPTANRKAFETRLNFAATVQVPLRRFTFTDRNLFERRFRDPVNLTRYRNRLQVSHPLKINGSDFTVYLADEVFYDFGADAWVRNRAAAGITKRVNKNLTLDFYYMRQNDGRGRPGDINIIGSVFRLRF